MKSIAIPRVLSGRESLGYVGCTFDITDMKEAESLHEMLDRSKDEFLAMLAHELRNPLAAIRNAIHVLTQQEGDAAATASAHGVLDRQTRNMMRMVDDLLDVSRVTHGKIHLRDEALDLNQVVRSSVSATEYDRSRRGQELRLSTSPSPLTVRGDAARLEQVVSNLLINASKFTQSGGHIHVEVKREGADQALITVRDDGQGIDSALVKRVFDLFVQGVSVQASSVPGLGIGLTLARKLVEMHGGTIEAASAGKGAGSQFTIRLPRAQGAQDEAPPAAAAPKAKSARQARKVLVIDDNTDAAESQLAILGFAGHEARMAHDGPSGIALAREFRPDLILLDIGLPGMSGYEVAQALRHHPETKRTYLVALTGFGRPDDIERARREGFNEHLTKPVDPDYLLDLIDKRAEA
jgi:two-component system CheB/CheR fusion protein